MKQLIISKTYIFIIIVLFVSGFQKIFGEINSLIGATIMIAALTYLERDLTIHPWKNFFWLLTVNVLQGVFAYISTINMWVGLPLNFISLFIVGFFFTSSLKKPLYVSYGLQYIFLISTPVTPNEFPIRLLALASAAVIIMLSQLVFNRNKLVKEGNKHIIQVCDNLIKKLKKVNKDEDSTDYNNAIEASIKGMRKVIYEKRIRGFYLSNESRMRLKISVCLEKMYFLLGKLSEKSYKHELIPILIDELKKINEIVSKGEMQTSDLSSFYVLQKKYNSTLLYEMIRNFELFYEILQSVTTMEKDNLNKVETIVDIPSTYTSSYQHLININKNSVRFTYAIRLALIMSIAALISDYFGLEQGKWILFTIFSVTQPYSENAKFRFKERIIGTLIGAIILLVLFSIVTGSTGRLILVFMLGYIQGFADAVSYRMIVITVTLCALSSASLIGDPQVLTFERISYVLLGIVIGMIGNRLILPHSVKKSTEQLVKMYKETSMLMLKEVNDYSSNISRQTHSINNLFIISSLIEDRILLNNATFVLDDADTFLQKQKSLNHLIYELFLYFQYGRIDEDTVKEIGIELKSLVTSTEDNYIMTHKKLKDKLLNTNSLDEKIILHIILEIAEECKETFSFMGTFKTT